MKPFQLKIVTPDGLIFEGQAASLSLRTVDGEIGIRADHIPLITALGMGRCVVMTEEGSRSAACIGGMLSVTKDLVSVVATTFEWADEIDTQRAEASYQRAQKVLQDKNASKVDLTMAEARLKRALIRRTVGTKE